MSEEQEFVERISAPLRAGERLDDSFEARVMSAAYADMRAGIRRGAHGPDTRGWWRRPRTVSVSPIAIAALAAGLVGIALLGGAGIGAALRAPTAAPSTNARLAATDGTSRDTVHIVRFVLDHPNAKSIALVGDFNDWSRGTTPLVRSANGHAWVVSVALPPGRHEYAFLVTDDSGEHWIADPLASTLHDDFGTESSVMLVGGEMTHGATNAS